MQHGSPTKPAPGKRQRRQQRGRAAKKRRAAGKENGSTADESAAEEAEEREEKQAAAEAHLAELTLGFARDSGLAPWLRRLLQLLEASAADEQQQLAERVWQLATQYSELDAWRPRAEAACAAAGQAPPQRRHEWLPLATGWCVVFEVSALACACACAAAVCLRRLRCYAC